MTPTRRASAKRMPYPGPLSRPIAHLRTQSTCPFGSSRSGARSGSVGVSAATVGAVRRPLTTRPVRRGRRSRLSRALLDAPDVARVVDRIAHQLLEKTGGAAGTVV